MVSRDYLFMVLFIVSAYFMIHYSGGQHWRH
jgi:hypothetical protein